MPQDNDLQEQLGKKLRKIFDDVMAEPSPFPDPPDQSPPRGAPAQRIPRLYDEPPEEAEAAERHVA